MCDHFLCLVQQRKPLLRNSLVAIRSEECWLQILDTHFFASSRLNTSPEDDVAISSKHYTVKATNSELVSLQSACYDMFFTRLVQVS